MRVPAVEDVFALGDCAGFLEQTGKPVLPALAQVSFYLWCFAEPTDMDKEIKKITKQS